MAMAHRDDASGDNADLDLLAVDAFARGGARLASRARSSRAMIDVSSRVGREGATTPEPTRNAVTLVMSRGRVARSWRSLFLSPLRTRSPAWTPRRRPSSPLDTGPSNYVACCRPSAETKPQA